MNHYNIMYTYLTVHVCSSYELQPVPDKSTLTEISVVESSPEYEVIPAFSEFNNPMVMSNIAYGTVQLQQHESRQGTKMPAIQEIIGDDFVANSPQDSGLAIICNPALN